MNEAVVFCRGIENFHSRLIDIAKALKLVQARWLEVHPPVNWNQPYQVRKIISYADTRFHQGTIYKAANFRETGRTVSAKRHKNTRGEGMDGAELIRFIYDLDEPRRCNGAMVQQPLMAVPA